MCLESGRRNRAIYTKQRDDRYEGRPDRGSLQGVSQQARLHESAHSELLSVAVFGGLSGRTNRFGLILVQQLARLQIALAALQVVLSAFSPEGKRAESAKRSRNVSPQSCCPELPVRKAAGSPEAPLSMRILCCDPIVPTPSPLAPVSWRRARQ